MSKFLIAGLAVLGLVFSQAVAAEKTGKAAGGEKTRTERGAKGAQGDVVAEMTKVLALNDDMQAKVKAKVDAGKAAMDKWATDNKDKMDQNQKDMKAAREASDKAAGAKAQEAQKALEADRAKLMWDSQQDTLSLLTPEQRLTWQSYVVAKGAKTMFAKVELTDAQNAKIDELSKDAGKQVVDAKDAKAVNEIQMKFSKSVRETVLTDDQRAKLGKGADTKATGKGEGKAAKGDKGAKAGAGDKAPE